MLVGGATLVLFPLTWAMRKGMGPDASGSPAMAAGEFEEKGIVYQAIARPRWLELTTGLALAVSVVALVAVLVRKWRREGSVLPLAPLACYLVTVWWWMIESGAD